MSRDVRLMLTVLVRRGVWTLNSVLSCGVVVNGREYVQSLDRGGRGRHRQRCRS